MKEVITRQIIYKETFRTAKAAGIFDISPEKKLKRSWEVNLPIEDQEWQIGLIVGSSGSGKTTIAKNFFSDSYCKGFDWDERSILDNFDETLDIKVIIDALCHIGFSSPPNWLLPYHSLSNGQQFRVDIARILLDQKELSVIDEFTSVVDRTVAKISCAAINKIITRQKTKKLIAVSCHKDIIDWLQPDWIYDVDKDEFKWVRLRRPQIEVKMYQCSKSDKSRIWEIFKHHHYLSTNLAPASQAFVGIIDNEFCGFTSMRAAPICTGNFIMQEHRTVVLPDYQGVGIGNRLSAFLGEFCWNKYHKFLRSTTSHPAMIFHRNKNSNWQLISKPRILKAHNSATLRKVGSYNRLTASFKFIPNIPQRF